MIYKSEHKSYFVKSKKKKKKSRFAFLQNNLANESCQIESKNSPHFTNSTLFT